MATRQSLFIAAAFLNAITVGIGAQEVLSMKQEARMRGGAFTHLIYLTIPALPMRDMARASDLVVRARITAKVARLSDDESTVFTDYTITLNRVLKRPPDLGIAKVPGEAPSIVLREVGGVVNVDGLRLETQSDSHDPDRDPLGIESAPAVVDNLGIVVDYLGVEHFP